jgi:hypothetical protein
LLLYCLLKKGYLSQKCSAMTMPAAPSHAGRVLAAGLCSVKVPANKVLENIIEKGEAVSAQQIRGFLLLLAAMLSSSLVPQLYAQNTRVELNQLMVESANTFLDSLSEFQRGKGVFDFDSEERLNWHFIPRRRNGVLLKSMNEQQRSAANNLLQTFFSAKGYSKAERVRGLETVLAEIEVNGRFTRDPEVYYISVFGKPGMDSEWALRYEGHHLAFNWTFVRGLGIASTPQFFGSNPAEVRSGSQIGTRVLGIEEDMGRRLVQSLSQQQLEQALLQEEVPRDIITGNKLAIEPLTETGISFDELDSQQQQILLELIEEVASAQPAALASQRMEKIRQQGLGAVKFTWIGSTEYGEAHYFRVQAADFLIEYDNTQNSANHVHLVWRDFDGDFGRDLLRQHYDSVALLNGPGHQH